MKLCSPRTRVSLTGGVEVVEARLSQRFREDGDGEQLQVHSCCQMGDLTESLTLLINKLDEFTRPLNLGHSTRLMIIELAEKKLELMSSRSWSAYPCRPADDTTQSQPRVSFISYALAWEPQVSLEAGSRPTKACFDALQQGEVQ